MFVETDDADYETLALPSVRPKGFASPSASRAVAIVSPTVNDDVGGGGRGMVGLSAIRRNRNSPRFPDANSSSSSYHSGRTPRSRTLTTTTKPKSLGLRLSRIKPAAYTPTEYGGNYNNDNSNGSYNNGSAAMIGDGNATMITGRNSVGIHTAATPKMTGGRKSTGGGEGGQVAGMPPPTTGSNSAVPPGIERRQKMEDEYYRPTMLWEEDGDDEGVDADNDHDDDDDDDDDDDENDYDDEDDDEGGDAEEALDDGELPSLRRVGSGASDAGKIPTKKKSTTARARRRLFPGFMSKHTKSSMPPPLVEPSTVASIAAERAARIALSSNDGPIERLKVAGFWSQLDMDDVDDMTVDEYGRGTNGNEEDDGDDDDDNEMPMDERREYSMSPTRRRRFDGGGGAVGVKKSTNEEDGRWAKSIGMDIVEGMDDEEDCDDGDVVVGRKKRKGDDENEGGTNGGGGMPYLLRKAACYANDAAARDSVNDEEDDTTNGGGYNRNKDGSIIGKYEGTIVSDESDDDQSLDRTFGTPGPRTPVTGTTGMGETVVNDDDDDEGGNPVLRCINDALSTICGFGIGGDYAPATTTNKTTTTTTGNATSADDIISPAKRRALEIVERNNRRTRGMATTTAVVSDGEESLDGGDELTIDDVGTIEEDTAIELQYHAINPKAGGADERGNAFRLIRPMPGLMSPKRERGDNMKSKKTGFEKLMNIVSPKRNRGNDDDLPRKTLVTTTTRREADTGVDGSDITSQRPPTKLMDMHSSLTFEQEILGVVDDDGGDDRPEIELCDHRVDDNGNEDGGHRRASTQGEHEVNASGMSSATAAAKTDLNDEDELQSEAAAWSTNKKNLYLRKLAERAKMEYAAKAATVGVLAERAKTEYAARASVEGGGNATGSAGKEDGRTAASSQAGATSEIMLPALLPMTDELRDNASVTAADKSVRRDGDGPTSYNADYNSFDPAQKRLFLRLLNSGMSPKDAVLQISQERDSNMIGAENEAAKEDTGYTSDDGLGSPIHLDNGDQHTNEDDLDSLLAATVASVADISESEMAQGEGKSSYQEGYKLSTAVPLVPAIIRAKSRSKSRERYQMHNKDDYQENEFEQAVKGRYQQEPESDSDGLPSSGISYYDSHGHGLDPNDRDCDDSGLLDDSIDMPRGRSRKGKFLGGSIAAKVISSRQGGLGKRDVRYKNITTASALPSTMEEGNNSAAPISPVNNVGGVKSEFNILSPRSLSSALNFRGRYPKFSKLDSDLDLDQVAPSRSAELEGMPSWLLPRVVAADAGPDDDDDDDHVDENDDDYNEEDDEADGYEDEGDILERNEADEYDMEEDEIKTEDELDEYEEDMEDEYASEEEETMDDDDSEGGDEAEPQSIPSPPPESTWISPEIGQTRKTDDIVSPYNDTPGNGDTVSLQGSNVDSLMLSPDSMYSPVNSPRLSASKMDGTSLEHNVEDMPAMTPSLASDPEEDVTSYMDQYMDQSTMDGSTLTSASKPLRKRHKGAASKRLLQAKQAEERFGSPKRNGWVNSIRDAASTQGQVWDPILGWVNYSEPEIHGVVDHDYSSIGSLHLTLPHKSVSTKGDHDTASNRRMAAEVSFITSTTDDNDTAFDSMTGNTVNTSAEAYSVNGASISAPRHRVAPRHRATDRRKIASLQQDKKPVGWKESMENATAVVNYDGKGRYWDYEKGWVRADGTVDDDVSVLTRSVYEGDQQMNQRDSVEDNRNDISKIAVAEESIPLVHFPPVVGELPDDASSEEAKMTSKGIEHIGDYPDNVNISDTIQPQGSDKENHESEGNVSSVSPKSQQGDQVLPFPVPHRENNKRSLNIWLEHANKNAHPQQDDSENVPIVSDDTRASSTSDNLLVYDNNSKAGKSQPHYSNFPDSFGEIERGVQEVKVVKEKFSDADSDLFEPSKIGVSQNFINIMKRTNIEASSNLSPFPLQRTEHLALHKTESQDSNSTGLPPPPPPRPHHSTYREYQSRPTVPSAKSPEDASAFASELDSNAPQVITASGVISSTSNAIPSQMRSDPPQSLDPPSTSTGITVSTYIGTRNAKKASDSWIQSRKDMGEIEVEKVQAPPSDKTTENREMRNFAAHRSKFENNGVKSAPIFVPTKNNALENQVLFRSTAMGIRLKRGEDGYVRVVSVTEASAGSSIVRDGIIEPEDMVLEAAGVDLRKPITNSQWGETVTKIRNAPRPMLFMVAAGPKRKEEEKQEYQQSQSSIHPPPAKFVMESRLSKSPEGQEVLESLSAARSYERVLETLSKTESRSPGFAPPSTKSTNNTSSQTSVDAGQTVSTRTVDNDTVSEEDQTASRTEYDEETRQIPQNESLLRRITAGCVSPVAACAAPASQSSQQSSGRSNSDDEGHVPMAHLQFLRTNPTIARVASAANARVANAANAASRRYPALCGRPDTIFEEPSDDDTRETRNFRMNERSSRRDVWGSSSRSTASTNDDGSRTMTTATTYTKTVGSITAGGSMESSGSGDNTAFLEKLSIQSTIATKSTRFQNGEGNKTIISKATYGLSRHLITGAQSQPQEGDLEWPDSDDEQRRSHLSSEGAIYDASASYSNRKKTQTARQAEFLAAAKVEDMMNELQDVDPDDQCEI